MRYTIGTAISRAQDEGRPVDLLVDGHWLGGLIVGYAAIGVVLEDGVAHSVVRVEKISAVRVREQVSAAPASEAPGAGPRRRGARVQLGQHLGATGSELHCRELVPARLAAVDDHDRDPATVG